MRKILFFLFINIYLSAFPNDNTIQLTGILMSNDSSTTISFANIMIKNKKQGTISDFYGYFSLAANKGDTIIFSCLGYKKATYIIPKKTTENFITLIQKLKSDTIILNETKVYPWPSRERFKYVFLSTDIVDDDIERAKKNINNAFVDIMIAEMPNDGKENFKNFIEDMERQQYIMSGGATIIPILNPFAWAAFIEGWKNGDFKRKE